MRLTGDQGKMLLVLLLALLLSLKAGMDSQAPGSSWRHGLGFGFLRVSKCLLLMQGQQLWPGQSCRAGLGIRQQRWFRSQL